MIQLGIRLHDTIKGTLEERLDYIKGQGFVCSHVALSKVMKQYPLGEGCLTPGYAMYIKNLFAKYKIDIAVLGCYLNLAYPEKEQLNKITNKYMEHIRFASLLGCGVVGTETGAPNREYQYEPICHTEQSLLLFIENIRPIVQYAEKMGVILAIEPVWNHIVWNAKSARRVLDEVGSPNLQIIFDPVNLLSIQNYKDREAIIQEAIELLGKEVAVIHIKDFEIVNNQLISIAAGTGQMNYNSITTFMKERKPFIHATLENTKPDNAVAAKDYMIENYNRN